MSDQAIWLEWAQWSWGGIYVVGVLYFLVLSLSLAIRQAWSLWKA